MINTNRIVPIMKCSFLTMIGIILNLIGTTYAILKAADVEGNFEVTDGGNAGNLLADQPVKTLNFSEDTTAAVVYFVADYYYDGFQIDGTAVTTTGDDVENDGITLYKATLASGAVTIAAVSPVTIAAVRPVTE